jgi:hypothetical protein
VHPGEVEQGRKHIRDLEATIQAFYQTGPYVVRTKRDPQSRRLIYYVASVREAPPVLAAVAGDALQNLRSALDHLAYELVLLGTGGRGPTRHVYFPISDDAAKYKTETPGKVQGMRPEAMKAIDAIKPYGGGNDVLWRLHKLNNVDKHRTLILVGSAYRSANLGAHVSEMMRKLQPDIPIPKIDAYFRPADRLFPLKVGDELLIDAPDAEESPGMDFQFDVAFGEPGIVEDAPLLEALQEMAGVVADAIGQLRPLLDNVCCPIGCPPASPENPGHGRCPGTLGRKIRS